MANETSGIKKFIESTAADPAEKQKQIDALNNLQDAITEKRAAAASDIETLSSITKSALDAISVNMSNIKADFKQAGKVQAEYREELAELKKVEGELTEEQKERIKTLEREIVLLQQKQQEAKQSLIIEKSNKKVIESTNTLLQNKLGLGKEMNDSFLGALFASDNAFKGIKASVQENLKPQKLLASALAQVQKATIEFNKTLDTENVKLQQASGGALGMSDGLVSVTTQNRRFNADLKTTGEIMAALNNQISLFNQMSPEQQKRLTETSVKLKAMGVSAETSAKSFDVMLNSLGMSQDMAEATTVELAALAKTTGMSAEAIIDGFGSASSELSKYGKDMVREFKAIAGAAEATGISIDSLMNITKQFDTFEGAATHAGKLNAILGGGVINSMDLLNATEEERVRLLIQSIKASGKNFENMNRFEKQAIMNAAGITDMNEAQKLFTQSLSEYDMQVEKSKAAQQTNEEFEEMAKQMVSISDKLKQLGKSFAVAFDFMIPIASKFLDILLFITDNLAILTTVGIGGLIVGTIALAKAFNIARVAIGKGVKGLTKDITEGLGEGLANVSEGVGESIEFLSEGVAKGVEAVGKSFGNAAPAISRGLTSIGAGAMKATPGLAAIGVALIKVGAGVALIVLPIALLVVSIAMLIDSVVTLVKEVGGGQLVEIAGAFYLFALGLGQGLGLVSLAFTAFAATLVAVSYTSIGVLPILTAGLLGVAAVVAALTTALLLLPNQKLINLSVASEGIAKVMEASVKLTPEAVGHTKEIVTAAADYVKVQAEMLSPDMDAFVQALRGAAGGGGGGGQDIVLVLNDREFARAVNVALNRSNNLGID